MYPVITIIVIIALIVLVFFFLLPKRTKGERGEREVSRALGKSEKDVKYVINNITIVSEGKSSQIDHLFINKNGIFVIETKNYAGQIYCNENGQEWTQSLQYGKVKNKFYNPIKQNKTHIYALSKVLDRSDCFISAIVFPEAQLKNNTSPEVGNIYHLKKRINAQTSVIFSVSEMNSIYEKLLSIKNNPQVSPEAHIEQINQMKRNITNNICPRCGRPLVRRSGNYGEFLGCSGYPSCKFKTKL